MPGWSLRHLVTATLASVIGVRSKIWVASYFVDRALKARLLARIAPERTLTFADGLGSPITATVDVRLGGLSAFYEIAVRRVYWDYPGFEPQPGDTVIDVGANIGFFTSIVAHRIGPTGRLLAVEPYPPSFKLLDRNSRNLPASIFTHQVGCSDTVGDLPMSVPPGHGVMASFVITYAPNSIVPVVPLDDLVTPELDGEISLLKIDVEGWEHEVLSGARNTLERTKRVVIEVGANRAPHVIEFMKAAGFDFVHSVDGIWGGLDLKIVYFEHA